MGEAESSVYNPLPLPSKGRQHRNSTLEDSWREGTVSIRGALHSMQISLLFRIKRADYLIHFNLTSIYRVVAGTGQEKEQERIQNGWTLPDLPLRALHWGRQAHPPWVQDGAELRLPQKHTRGGGVVMKVCPGTLPGGFKGEARRPCSWLKAEVCGVVGSREEACRKNNSNHMTCRSWHEMKRLGLVQYHEERQEDDSQVSMVSNEPHGLPTMTASGPAAPGGPESWYIGT